MKIKQTYNKLFISNILSSKTGLPSSLSQKLINDLIDILKIEINSNKVNLKNFGTFKVIKKMKRQGRNPKTKEIFEIKARKIISFSSSKKINKLLNS